ncbi:hypothetical protein Sgleb_03170 [Streptomyces glebosus]|uniref:Uncharacterized protein n=1 Tax=Streptomyces glebosus TaxID=249580 RepID=A0A640SMQ4_9ACTN|nr:hypothetical protein Sgleb_03170 [Streptomyces glebosus]GHG72204.1 hypothetical protein GCM10010513_44820 [Streptomyces glebosus]
MGKAQDIVAAPGEPVHRAEGEGFLPPGGGGSGFAECPQRTAWSNASSRGVRVGGEAGAARVVAVREAPLQLCVLRLVEFTDPGPSRSRH